MVVAFRQTPLIPILTPDLTLVALLRTIRSCLHSLHTMAEKTIFQKIADREIPASLIHEDEHCIAFHDINPKAPTHVLIVPRKLIPTLNDLTPDDTALVGHLFLVAKELAAKMGLTGGYRTVFNCGEDGGQSVYHIHLHLLGGRKMGWPPG